MDSRISVVHKVGMCLGLASGTGFPAPSFYYFNHTLPSSDPFISFLFCRLPFVPVPCLFTLVSTGTVTRVPGPVDVVGVETGPRSESSWVVEWIVPTRVEKGDGDGHDCDPSSVRPPDPPPSRPRRTRTDRRTGRPSPALECILYLVVSRAFFFTVDPET